LMTQSQDWWPARCRYVPHRRWPWWWRHRQSALRPSQ
jgi:hypothetical protein